jgi:hypothetical protein
LVYICRLYENKGNNMNIFNLAIIMEIYIPLAPVTNLVSNLGMKKNKTTCASPRAGAGATQRQLPGQQSTTQQLNDKGKE